MAQSLTNIGGEIQVVEDLWPGKIRNYHVVEVHADPESGLTTIRVSGYEEIDGSDLLKEPNGI